MLRAMRSSVLLAVLVLACGGGQQNCPSPTPPECMQRPAVEVAEAEPAPPPEQGAIAIDGCAEVTPELRARLNPYVNTRSASLAALSPRGDSAIVLTRFAETAQIHEVDHPMGDRSQLTFLEEPVRRAEPLVSDPNSVLYLIDVGGAEDYQIYKLDRRNGRSALLTDGTSRHETWVTSFDGSRIAFNNNARNGRDIDVYVSDGFTSFEGARRISELTGSYAPLDFTRDNRRLLITHYVSINDSRLYVADLESGELTRITPEEPVAAYRAALFDREGQRLYVTTDRDGEFVELYEVNLAAPNDPWRPLSRDIRWNVEEIALSHDGRTLAFTTNEDGFSVLRLLDTRTRRAQLVSGMPRGIVSGLGFARQAPVLGFTTFGATTTGDAYSYDLRRRVLTRWTESEVGGLDRSTFIEPTLVRYRTFDEREIPALYYRPRGDGPFPVVVSIHGGPEAQARPYFSPLTQYLAVESGVAVLVPNVRGSDGYGKSYLMLDNGRLREDSVRDIGALLDWITAQPELDEGRTAVYGGSYGGYMVLASLVHFGDRLRAGIDMVGISSFPTFLSNTSDYRQDLRRVEYGDERDPAMLEFLGSISPLRRASEIESALFVAHGANDPRVPVSEAEQLVGAVRAAGQEVCYLLARNEGHGFRRKENVDLFTQISVMFLEAQLAR
jgi:dipeptidyl aminopeptidase/acylaminoacyl peptidase